MMYSLPATAPSSTSRYWRWHHAIWLGLLLTLFMGYGSERASAQDIDRILVIVNDDVITERELEARLSETRKQLTLQKIKLPPADLFRKQVLEHAIVEQIQLQLARAIGLQVREEQVDNAIENVARGNKMTVDALFKTFQKQGIDVAQYRNQVRQQLLIQRLVEREVSSRVTISDSEVDNFLQQRYQRLGRQDAYNLSHIMVPLTESATPEALKQAREQAEKILAILKKGADFQETAVAYSKGASALEGGNLGWKDAGQLPDLFLAALDTLQPGDISEILRSPNGFHLLKLNDKRSAGKSKAVTQTRARHILMQPDAIRSETDVRAKLMALRDRIEHGEDFAALAKAHSEDPVSAAAGGDLGWFNPGQMVPEFEKAANAAPLNAVSQPVKSPFGLHLIQVLERRQMDIGEQLDRNEARQQLHGRKADERYQQWLMQLRDEAFVQFVTEDSLL